MRKTAIYIVLIATSLCMVVPFIWMLTTSLKSDQFILRMPPQLIPEEPTLDGYRTLFRIFPMFRMLVNSIVVTVSVTAGQILTSSMAAYAFARIPFKGRSVLFSAYLATLMVPFQVTVTPLFILMTRFGWINTYAGLIVPGLTSAFGTFLMRQALMNVPVELEESAFMDGAHRLQAFVRIVMPLVKPALATLFILAFMNAWNSFLWPLIVTRDTTMMTLPVGLASLHGRYETKWNLVMAGSLFTSIPMITVFLAAQKQFIQGIARSGIKN